MAMMLLAVAARHAAAAGLPTTLTDAAACTFPVSLKGLECWGLHSKRTDKMGHPLVSAAQCEATCCAEPSCSTWNWNSTAAAAGLDGAADSSPRCWVLDKPGGKPQHCNKPTKPADTWVGGRGRGEPPPPPAPPATPPGTPKALTIIPGQAPTPLPFTLPAEYCTDPAGRKFSVDSLSLLRSDQVPPPLPSWLGGAL